MTCIKTIFFDWDGVIAGAPDNGHLVSLLKSYGASDHVAQEIYTTQLQRFMRGELTETDLWDEIRSTSA